ncbi:unnamed protein product [Mytilus edulis]|uniref:Uncharacterized protein n=1 Tax=Mytilus edulis TaxID=6550 RepID=A0A8S3SXJ4_MYTED|nr:unnamed protein product [Mytilus edulis]
MILSKRDNDETALGEIFPYWEILTVQRTFFIDERIPEEIRNMEQQSIDIYKRALKSGSEKKRDINLVIVDEDKEYDINNRIQKSFVNHLCMTDNDERKPDILQGMSGRPNVEDLVKEDIIYENTDENDAINGRTKISTRETDSTGQIFAVDSDQPAMLESYTIPKPQIKLHLKNCDEEFYATHQTFLNPDAVYLVVANLNDKDNTNHEHGM